MNQIIKIKALDKVVKEIDLFICSASFELRCFDVPSVISKSIDFKKAIVFSNNNEYKEITTNAKELVKKLGKNKARNIEINTNDSVSNAITINQILDELFASKRKIKNILLDTTTFTHETLLVLFKFLFLKREKYEKLMFVYVGARAYSINESDPQKKWLSSGISSIRTVIGYPGMISPARKNHLIVLFGFESERTKNLIEHLEFDRISLGFGAKEKSIDVSHQSINFQRHSDLMRYFQNADKFEISLVDAVETKENILEQIKKYPNYNTVIAPMNNKISTIGAALVAIENPKTQLIYAKPIEYNVKGYSEARDDCYYFELTF